MQFCRKTMLTAVYWNVNRLQGFLDEVCFELLLCLSLSLFSNKPRLKSVHLRLQQSDGPHFQKGRPRKKAQTRKKIAFATSSARSNSCHSRSIYLKAAGRNNLTLQWILIWTFDECESYIGGSRKMLKSGTKPYAHSTNSPKWHGRRNLSAERKHYLSLHFLFVPKKFDFLFSLKSNSWFVNIKSVAERKWRCWKGYQAFLFIETVKNAILLILYKERTFLRMLQGEDDMSKACSCYFSPLAPTILFAASRLFLLPLWGQTRGESQRNDTSQNTQSTTIVTRLELQACSSIQA